MRRRQKKVHITPAVLAAIAPLSLVSLHFEDISVSVSLSSPEDLLVFLRSQNQLTAFSLIPFCDKTMPRIADMLAASLQLEALACCNDYYIQGPLAGPFVTAAHPSLVSLHLAWFHKFADGHLGICFMNVHGVSAYRGWSIVVLMGGAVGETSKVSLRRGLA